VKQDIPARVQSAGPRILGRRSLVVGSAALLGAATVARAFPPRDVALEAFLRDQMARGGIPGLAVGVARHGTTLLRRGFGYADIAQRRRVTTDSMFHIASVTKTVTTAGIMLLVEAGRLGLDDPIDRHIDFSVVNPAYPDIPITVRHLLTHMSSISDETYYEIDFRTHGADSPLVLGAFLKDYLAPGGAYRVARGNFSPAAPGTSYDYSNVAFGLLGYLGGRVAGEDFRVFIRRHVFDPLGMRHASWTIAGVSPPLRVTPYDVVDEKRVAIDPVGFPDWPTGMLRVSIASFMPFVAACANRGVAGSTRLLSAASTSRMLTMHRPPGLPAWLTGQGLGWMESADGGTPHINHWGGDPGVFTAAYLDPASATGVAIFANVTASAASKAAIKAIARRLLDPAGIAHG
jgi:CubicO group peptidase (beta-lactamase class C family)